MNLKAILEGLLFVVGEEGLSLTQAKDILDIDGNQLTELIAELQKDYLKEERGIQLDVLGDALKLVTKKEHHEYYQKLLDVDEDEVLSQASLETLAIIAYNEPVTRVEIDEIRGVGSAHIIRRLLAKTLIQEIGRSELPGRPRLYGITKEFLDYFGLASKEQLPKLEEIAVEEVEDTDLFTSRYKEETD